MPVIFKVNGPAPVVHDPYGVGHDELDELEQVDDRQITGTSQHVLDECCLKQNEDDRCLVLQVMTTVPANAVGHELKISLTIAVVTGRVICVGGVVKSRRGMSTDNRQRLRSEQLTEVKSTDTSVLAVPLGSSKITQGQGRSR